MNMNIRENMLPLLETGKALPFIALALLMIVLEVLKVKEEA